MTVETKSPTSNSGNWLLPTGAYTKDDGNYAVCSVRSDTHLYYDYFFGLAGKTIDKVEIGIEFYCQAAESVRVRVSWDGGVTWSDWSQKFTLTGEDIIWVNFTSVTDWTAEKLSDANLRVDIEFGVGGGAGCFAPDTLILMADGSQKQISKVKLGDKVVSKDGVATVTAKTVHKSLHAKYLLVKFKGVALVPTHLIWEDSEWHTLSEDLPIIKLKEVVNIETSTGSLIANKLLVHNIEKQITTAHLDWIPVRVTFSEAIGRPGVGKSKSDYDRGIAKGFI